MKSSFVPAALLGLMLWEYAPAMHGTFVYQDDRWTEGCDRRPFAVSDLLTPRSWPRSLMRWSWCGQLAQASSPWQFHALNLLLHVVVLALWASLVWSLTLSVPIVAVSVLFLGVNVLAMESVAYLSGRTELLSAAGIVVACIALRERAWIWMLVAFAFALAAKESAIVGIAALGMVWGTRRAVAISVVALMVIVIGVGIWASLIGTWAGALPWLGMQAVSFVSMLLLSVSPLHHTVAHDLPSMPTLVQLGAVGLLGVVAMWAVSRFQTVAGWGVLWALVTVLPRFVVQTPLSLLNEHQMYVPLLGLSLAVAAWVTGQSDRLVLA